MTDLQKRFCYEYVVDYNATKAGIRAGLKAVNAKQTSWTMLQLPHVQDLIEQLQQEAKKRCGVTEDELLAEFKKVGFANMRDYIHDNLSYKTLDDVKNPEVIKSVKKTVRETEMGDVTTVEFVLHDKISALINIGKHIGFFKEDNAQRKLDLKDAVVVFK